ncbi:MAG: hypothetical protein ABR924_11480 [Terracidiphilus sp.]|jgi:hypothetical protein
MEGFPPADQERHVYQLHWLWQVIHLAEGMLFGGIGIAFIVWSVVMDWNMVFLALFVSVVCVPVGFYLCAYALRSRVVLEDTRIYVRYALFERWADLSEIEYYYMIRAGGWGHDFLYWRLELKENRGHISIRRDFQVDDCFRAFLSQIHHPDEGSGLVSLHL